MFFIGRIPTFITGSLKLIPVLCVSSLKDVPLGSTVSFTASSYLHPQSWRACAKPRRSPPCNTYHISWVGSELQRLCTASEDGRYRIQQIYYRSLSVYVQMHTIMLFCCPIAVRWLHCHPTAVRVREWCQNKHRCVHTTLVASIGVMLSSGSMILLLTRSVAVIWHQCDDAFNRFYCRSTVAWKSYRLYIGSTVTQQNRNLLIASIIV